MHGYSRVIGCHPVILRPVSAPESAYLGLHIYRTPNIRPSARQPLKRVYRVYKNRPTSKHGFPVQSNFFAVISNPNTQAESTGFMKLTFWAPVHARQPPKRRNPNPDTPKRRNTRPESTHFFRPERGCESPPKTSPHRIPPFPY